MESDPPGGRGKEGRLCLKKKLVDTGETLQGKWISTNGGALRTTIEANIYRTTEGDDRKKVREREAATNLLPRKGTGGTRRKARDGRTRKREAGRRKRKTNCHATRKHLLSPAKNH